jgi:hypothetical protein
MTRSISPPAEQARREWLDGLRSQWRTDARRKVKAQEEEEENGDGEDGDDDNETSDRRSVNDAKDAAYAEYESRLRNSYRGGK